MAIGSVQIINVQGTDYAIIDEGNGGFTSMTKVYHDAQISAQVALLQVTL